MTELAWWQTALAVLVAIIGSARLTRVITYDDFPPSVWFRVWFRSWAKEDWHKLVECPWCMGPWVTLVAIGTFLLTFVHPAFAWLWWLFWAWMAMSYLVSQYVYWDEGKPDE